MYARFLGSKGPYIQYRIYLRLFYTCSQNESVPGFFVENLDNNQVPANPNLKATLDSVIRFRSANDPCIVLPDSQQLCYFEVRCHADFSTIPNRFGYRIFFRDCCRFDGFSNLSHAYPYEFGVQYQVIIPGTRTGSPDNSPVYRQDSLFLFCQDSLIRLQAGGTDPDGDSLAYDFFAPQTGGIQGGYQVSSGTDTISVNVRGQPLISDPYVFFNDNPYTDTQPLGPGIQIDPHTGTISGTLDQPGNYLIGARTREYRNGRLLQQIVNDWVVHIYNCGILTRAQAAIPPVLSSCLTLSVAFPNGTSPGAPYLLYQWDFGDGYTSSEEQPVHVYADSGTYEVRLIVNPGLYCADTALRQVSVYPGLDPSFSVEDTCLGDQTGFLNTSSTAFGLIDSSLWYFGDGDSSRQPAPLHRYRRGDTTFKVHLFVTSDRGCLTEDSQYVTIVQLPPPLYIHDTLLTLGLPFRLEGVQAYGLRYLWYPATGLEDPLLYDPLSTINRDFLYHLRISSGECVREDSLQLRFYKGPDLYVPNAFTPNGDGLNDLFRPIPVGLVRLDYFRVFDRWGRLMFQTRTPMAGWDGTYKGHPAPEGTYVWEAAGMDLNKRKILKNGTVILLR